LSDYKERLLEGENDFDMTYQTCPGEEELDYVAHEHTTILEAKQQLKRLEEAEVKVCVIGGGGVFGIFSWSVKNVKKVVTRNW
jgi:predicted alternative tryptophan synthase beta-subunit